MSFCTYKIILPGPGFAQLQEMSKQVVSLQTESAAAENHCQALLKELEDVKTHKVCKMRQIIIAASSDCPVSQNIPLNHPLYVGG